MRARMTLAFVVVLAVALVLAGSVSLLLVRHASANNAKRVLLAQVKAYASSPKIITLPGALPLLIKFGSISNANVMTVSADGSVHGSLPPGIPVSELGGLALATGHPVAASHGQIAYAAAQLFSVDGTTVVVWLESIEHFSDASLSYFLLAGGISLLVALALSIVISERIVQRINLAALAAQQIASGDFDTRIEPVRHAYPELARLNNAINSMAEDLARAQHGERQFLLSISHDLRTPLTSIRGYSEAIVEGVIDADELPRAAQVIVAETDRLERLIDDLLDLARLRAKRFSFTMSSFDLDEVVRSATEALPRIIASNVTLTIAIPPEPVEVIGDKHRVGQIAANLVENALKYARSEVHLSVTANGSDAVRIAVEDDGPGIAAEDLPKIFERLYTSDRHPSRLLGTGIGLAIVAELVEALGGSVDAHSPVKDGRGSRLEVRLPRRAVVTAPQD